MFLERKFNISSYDSRSPDIKIAHLFLDKHISLKNFELQNDIASPFNFIYPLYLSQPFSKTLLLDV